jgi:hypothetical protein
MVIIKSHEELKLKKKLWRAIAQMNSNEELWLK